MSKKYHFVLLALVLALFTTCYPVSRYIQPDPVLQWESAIRKFDSLNAVEYSDANTLLVTGSSSVRIWDSIHTDLAPFQVMQRGYGGAKLSDLNYYAHRIIKPHQFKAILVFVANDISGSEDDRIPREVLQLFKTLVRQIRERNPDTPVCWIEITPTPKRWHVYKQIHEANTLIRKYCERNEDLHFIETSDAYMTSEGLPDSAYFRKDMLHLNREGYLKWTERIKASLFEEGFIP